MLVNPCYLVTHNREETSQKVQFDDDMPWYFLLLCAKIVASVPISIHGFRGVGSNNLPHVNPHQHHTKVGVNLIAQLTTKFIQFRSQTAHTVVLGICGADLVSDL